MNFLKKLSNIKINSQDLRGEKDPDNSRLCSLLNIWAQQQSEQSYREVLQEILNGNGFVLVPSVNEERTSTNWHYTTSESALQLISLFDINGVKVLGAFSDELSLLKWAKSTVDYTAMPTQDLLDFCRTNNIDRVIINSGSDNMFLLERGRPAVSNSR